MSDSNSKEQVERERKQRLHQLYPELAAGAEVPAGPLGKIKLCFAESFAFWDICLPHDEVVLRRRGKILKAGWAIWYLFGSDGKGEYLDYYASHPMTNDRHVRIYADGREENLPVISPCHEESKNPWKNAQLEAEYYARNQQVGAMLEAKGFGIEGDEPGILQFNRLVCLHKPPRWWQFWKWWKNEW
jgi:hypothetical protein